MNTNKAVPVGLSKALIGIYEVRLQLQCLFECLYGFLTTKNPTTFQSDNTRGTCTTWGMHQKFRLGRLLYLVSDIFSAHKLFPHSSIK